MHKFNLWCIQSLALGMDIGYWDPLEAPPPQSLMVLALSGTNGSEQCLHVAPNPCQGKPAFEEGFSLRPWSPLYQRLGDSCSRLSPALCFWAYCCLEDLGCKQTGETTVHILNHILHVQAQCFPGNGHVPSVSSTGGISPILQTWARDLPRV